MPDEPEVVQTSPAEPKESPEEFSCPVCERVIPSPAPDTCPHCQAPIHIIAALLETADMSIAEAMRDLKSGDLRSASKRLNYVKSTSKSHRLHVEIVQAIIDRLSGSPDKALARLNAVQEKMSGESQDRNLIALLENVRQQCLRDQDSLAACCEHHNYSLFEARRGHYEEARRSLIKALNEVPWHADSHALLGKVYLALNETDDGKYHLRRALASDPKNPTATRLLNDISRSDKITLAKISGSIGDWIIKSPAWAGSIIVLVILAAIAVTAFLTK